MKNINQCPYGLIYNSFTIAHIQTFCAENITVGNDRFAEKFCDTIDVQIFSRELKFYQRYNLPGFDIKIEIDDKKKSILEGCVYVRAMKLFETCMQLSYRIVVVKGGVIDKKSKKKFCKINRPFNTDQLIVSAGIVQKVEHWETDKKTNQQTIDGVIKSVTISNIHLDKDSNYSENPYDETLSSFEEVMMRYRYYFDKECKSNDSIPAHLHTFIDVCDNIEHSGGDRFDSMSEAGIIGHIETEHKAELVGLMSLYPKEWSYRMDSSYSDICGRNIAIDTDDLVLTNSNLTLVIGTYGKRGGKEGTVDWKEHLKKRDTYHVCWPEYMVLVEMILAKKQTINYTITKYVRKSELISDKNRNTLKMIEKNAELSIKLSNVILQLDSIRYLRYISHKHMFKLAEENLGVPDDEQYLNEVIARIDNSLNNANNSIELQQARETNRILMVISVASLFGVLLQGKDVPIISTIFSFKHGLIVGEILLVITFAIIGFVISVLINNFRKTRNGKKF